jgi:HD superfamily phosphohydrolase
MIFHDTVYDTQEINEIVLLDLLASQAMQRLRGVLQHGVTALIGITSPVTRYDHSLGAMFLVRRLGGDINEQIAALLHDVSHTAFSHVIDYVFDDHDGQSYHDEHKEAYLSTTDVPEILAHHGYDWRQYLDENRFPILEQPAPRLCADRLDYFLRDSLDLGLATPVDVAQVLDHLLLVDSRIVTDDLKVARWLGNTYIAADDASWANLREVGLYEAAARAIRHALDIGALNESDIWGADRLVWAKMLAYDDPQLQQWLQLVSPATEFVWDDTQPTFRVSTKVRTIDPDIWVSSDLKTLSQLDMDFAAHRQSYLEQKAGKWPIRVI